MEFLLEVNCGKRARGFTLIELIVVITVISLLAIAVFLTILNAQAKARDSRRIAELRQIQTAVEVFKEVDDRYPGISNHLFSSSNKWRDIYENSNAFEKDMKNYLSPLPMGPSCSECNKTHYGLSYNYLFVKYGDMNAYELDTGLEIRKDMVSGDGGAFQKISFTKDRHLDGRYEVGSNKNMIACFNPNITDNLKLETIMQTCDFYEIGARI